jgi:glutathione S-transferase
VKNMLLGTPASHPTLAAELMLRRKGVGYERIDLVSGVHRALVKGLGFPAGTVPALFIEGSRIQGTRTISRALDVLVPSPPLFPEEADRRAEVERAELWGDLVLQSAARRLTLAALRRDGSDVAGYLETSRTGLPVGVAARMAPPFLRLSGRINRASDRSVRRDLASLPRMLASVDALVERGVVGGQEPNAADYQLATSLRLLMTLDDLRPLIEPRPAGRLASAVVPDLPGHVGRVFPPEWLSVR